MAALEPLLVSPKLKKLQAVVSKLLCFDIFYGEAGALLSALKILD
jgi:hypothetical protein